MRSRWTIKGNKKIFESPDSGKTVFERDIGQPHDTRKKLTTGEKIYGYHPQELLTAKILPIDIFYKLFGKEHE
tara:strand:+ start:353 stop:571 length:219 start_codon:yes stop_codon:yes gene_type:complete